jgi:hypothetical protein
LACAAATHQSLNGIVGGSLSDDRSRQWRRLRHRHEPRIAAIVGPIIVGWLFAAKLPLNEIVVFIAAPDLVVAAACVALDRLRRSRLDARGYRARHFRKAAGMSKKIPRLEMNELAANVQETLSARVKAPWLSRRVLQMLGHNPDVLVSFME